MAVRVMLVDDDDATRMIMAKFLEAEGYEVDGVESAEVALTWLQATHYDVLVTDLVMPGMSGLDLVMAAKAVNGTLRCIIASGHGPSVDVPAHVTWLMKPIDIEELLASFADVTAA
jgi:DNA-binding NtrC family response regulator